MRLPVLRCLPALAAALLLCVLPSCASLNDPLIHATLCDLRESGRPVINHDLKPVAEGAPTCIERGAGMDFDPPDLSGMAGTDAAWAYIALAVFYVLFYLGYCFGYACYMLGEVIWEACDTPSGDVEDEPEEQPETTPAPQREPYPRTK